MYVVSRLVQNILCTFKKDIWAIYALIVGSLRYAEILK